jgi:hypothetical protein
MRESEASNQRDSIRNWPVRRTINPHTPRTTSMSILTSSSLDSGTFSEVWTMDAPGRNPIVSVLVVRSPPLWGR